MQHLTLIFDSSLRIPLAQSPQLAGNIKRQARTIQRGSYTKKNIHFTSTQPSGIYDCFLDDNNIVHITGVTSREFQC